MLFIPLLLFLTGYPSLASSGGYAVPGEFCSSSMIEPESPEVWV